MAHANLLLCAAHCFLGFLRRDEALVLQINGSSGMDDRYRKRMLFEAIRDRFEWTALVNSSQSTQYLGI